MAKLAQHTINFPASPTKKVTGYKFYFEPAPGEVTYDSQSIYQENIEEAEITIDLTILLKDMAVDGLYNVAVSAIDEAGNESDMRKGNNEFLLSFVAPLPPGELFSM